MREEKLVRVEMLPFSNFRERITIVKRLEVEFKKQVKIDFTDSWIIFQYEEKSY